MKTDEGKREPALTYFGNMNVHCHRMPHSETVSGSAGLYWAWIEVLMGCFPMRKVSANPPRQSPSARYPHLQSAVVRPDRHLDGKASFR